MNQLMAVSIILASTHFCFGEQPITALLDTSYEEGIAALSARDSAIDQLVGRRIGQLNVKSVSHVGRLDPRRLADDRLGAAVNLFGLHRLDTQDNFADFQSTEPKDGDLIEITLQPRGDQVGKVVVVVFNIYAFGDFNYHKTVRVRDAPKKKFGRVTGIGRGVSNISFHFKFETPEPITLALVPETDDRWWFGSCDYYELGV